MEGKQFVTKTGTFIVPNNKYGVKKLKKPINALKIIPQTFGVGFIFVFYKFSTP